MKMSKNLREYIDLIESEQDHPHGTYAQVSPSNKSQRAIEKIIHTLGLKNPTASHDLHCTVTYSKKPCPELADYEPRMPVTGRVVGFKVFPTDDKFCLVLELDSPQLTELHEYALQLGCSHDYDEYTPHITLTYDWPDQQVPKLDVAGVSLVFDRFAVEALDPDWESKE